MYIITILSSNCFHTSLHLTLTFKIYLRITMNGKNLEMEYIISKFNFSRQWDKNLMLYASFF